MIDQALNHPDMLAARAAWLMRDHGMAEEAEQYESIQREQAARLRTARGMAQGGQVQGLPQRRKLGARGITEGQGIEVPQEMMQ